VRDRFGSQAAALFAAGLIDEVERRHLIRSQPRHVTVDDCRLAVSLVVAHRGRDFTRSAYRQVRRELHAASTDDAFFMPSDSTVAHMLGRDSFQDAIRSVVDGEDGDAR
jgi:hypothetical protein